MLYLDKPQMNARPVVRADSGASPPIAVGTPRQQRACWWPTLHGPTRASAGLNRGLNVHQMKSYHLLVPD